MLQLISLGPVVGADGDHGVIDSVVDPAEMVVGIGPDSLQARPRSSLAPKAGSHGLNIRDVVIALMSAPPVQ